MSQVQAEKIPVFASVSSPSMLIGMRQGFESVQPQNLHFMLASEFPSRARGGLRFYFLTTFGQFGFPCRQRGIGSDPSARITGAVLTLSQFGRLKGQSGIGPPAC